MPFSVEPSFNNHRITIIITTIDFFPCFNYIQSAHIKMKIKFIDVPQETVRPNVKYAKNIN